MTVRYRECPHLHDRAVSRLVLGRAAHGSAASRVCSCRRSCPARQGSVRWRFPARYMSVCCRIGYDPAWEGAVKLAEGKDMVLSLILAGQPAAARSLMVSPASPDGDPGKFLIDGKAARAIHRFDGWHVPISLGWFSGGYDQPVIHKTAFYWYAFAIPERGMYLADHYFVLRGLFGRPATSRTHRAA